MLCFNTRICTAINAFTVVFTLVHTHTYQNTITLIESVYTSLFRIYKSVSYVIDFIFWNSNRSACCCISTNKKPKTSTEKAAITDPVPVLEQVSFLTFLSRGLLIVSPPLLCGIFFKISSKKNHLRSTKVVKIAMKKM